MGQIPLDPRGIILDFILLERPTSIFESSSLNMVSPLVAVAESSGGTSQLLNRGSLFRCGHGQFLQSILVKLYRVTKQVFGLGPGLG